MKLKDIEDDNLFNWWTLVDKKGNKIAAYEYKGKNYSSYIGRKETDKEIKAIFTLNMELYKNYKQ